MSAPNCTVLLLTFARRGEERAIQSAMASLTERVPGARVIAVGTPVSAPVLRALGIADILVYGDGKSARQVIEEAQLFMPETVGIVYDDPGFRAHLKLEALAFVVGAKTIWRFRPGGEAALGAQASSLPVRMGRFGLALSVLAKGLQMLVRLGVGMALTGFACSYLCWYGRSRGGRGASRT